jgi:hypothetical protein
MFKTNLVRAASSFFGVLDAGRSKCRNYVSSGLVECATFGANILFITKTKVCNNVFKK